jgi:hypothetical protein
LVIGRYSDCRLSETTHAAVSMMTMCHRERNSGNDGANEVTGAIDGDLRHAGGGAPPASELLPG